MSSPVALFVYNRADNTRKTLDALLANTLAPQTSLYVFSDGGRDETSWRLVNEVRAVLHEVQEEVARTRRLATMTIVERPTNYYLERNVIEGINEVLSRHETIIVLEDDIVTAPYFLQFMNDAFALYKDEQRVMHVSGFTRLQVNDELRMTNDESDRMKNEESRYARNEELKLPSSLESNKGEADNSSLVIRHSSFKGSLKGEADNSSFFILHSSFEDDSSFYFTPFMAGWGWGTWRDRWQQHFRHYQSRAEALEGLTAEDLDALEYGGVFPCLKNLDRKPIPWDICWGIAIHRAHGLCLCPSLTLVRNIGLDSGTHYGRLPAWCTRLLQRYEYDREPFTEPVALSYREPAVDPQTEAAMKEALTDWGIRYTWLGMILKKLKNIIMKK